jgi:MoaA/NifB/PqqE/SkfB family radical SAM enzyme
MRSKILVWNVTALCNQKCNFCYGPKPNGIKEITTSEAKKKIDFFKEQKIKKIVFTGGEPLLRQDIVKLIKYANEKGLYTILHTNGELVTYSFLQEVDNYLDQINLPLDGYNERTNDEVRTKGHFQKILLLMQQLKNKDIKIIISTVAFSKNIKYINKIGQVLPSWINKWRVFQVRDVDEKLAVSSDIFKKTKLDSYPFPIQKVKRDDKVFDKTYEIVNNK